MSSGKLQVSIVVVLFSDGVITISDDIVVIEVDTPILVQFIGTEVSHNTNVFDVVVTQDMEFSNFSRQFNVEDVGIGTININLSRVEILNFVELISVEVAFTDASVKGLIFKEN